MPLPRTRLALMLAAALAATAMSLAVGVADSDSSQRGEAGDAILVARPARVDAFVTRLRGDERRYVSRSERTVNERLMLGAVLMGWLLVGYTAWRGVLVGRRRGRPETSLWSPQAGRSPPSPAPTA